MIFRSLCRPALVTSVSYGEDDRRIMRYFPARNPFFSASRTSIRRLFRISARTWVTTSGCRGKPGSSPAGCSTSWFRGRAWWPCPPTVCQLSWTAPRGRSSPPRRRRSADRRTCSRRSKAASRWTPSLAAARASPSGWPSTARAPQWPSPARASRQQPRSKRSDDGAGGSGSRAISCNYTVNAELLAIGAPIRRDRP